MADWKVIKTKIEIFDHPDAEKLQLGKIGTYQVVVQKGLYSGGEDVVFAPEKSVLSGKLEEEFKDYLVGPDKNRVKAIRLRGEVSSGIILSPDLVKLQCGKEFDELSEDELDVELGITKYIPPVPIEMAGQAEPVEHFNMSTNHDVEQYGVYESNFIENERVIASEKVHGSQLNFYYTVEDGVAKQWMSTKNYNKAGLHLLDSESNFYWRCARAINLFDMIAQEYKEGTVVQVFGEAIPCQEFKYNQSDPTMRIFDIRIDGASIPLDDVPSCFKEFWVPIIYDGPYIGVEDMKKLAKGMEQVSGRETHIKEGVVLRPYIDRRASDGTRLMVKILNPKYKETDEAFN